MSNVLSEEKKKQVIALGRLGWSLRRIEKAHRRPPGNGRRVSEGCRDRRAAAGRLGQEGAGKTGQRGDHRPGGRKTGQWGDHRLRRGSTPETQHRRHPATAASACEPYRELIENGLSRGRNAMAIWQELVDHHGFAGAYESVKRFVRKLRGPSSPEARAVINTAPGEESQVDYGTGPMVRDPQHRQVPPHAAVRADARLQPQVGSPAGVPFQRAHLGRAA